MSSLSRSLSCPSPSLSFPPDRKTETSDQALSSLVTEDHQLVSASPTTDFVTKRVDSISGNVMIRRAFHEHPLVLSTYLNVDVNVDEFNFCCVCKICFTVGVPIYSCLACYMCMHQSCGELPTWIHSTRHPQHGLKIALKTTYNEDCVDGAYKERILTCIYECHICYNYNMDIEDALHSMLIPLFKDSYLNRASSSLPLYLRKNTSLLKEEGLSIMYLALRKVDRIDHFYHEHPLVLSTYVNVKEIEEENESCGLCQFYFTEVVPIYSCDECEFFLHKSCAGLPQLIKSTLHPEHLLQFRPPVEENIYCDECDDCIDLNTRYTCQICEFDLHFECSLDSYLKSSLLGKSRYPRDNPKATATPYLSRSLSFPMEDKRKSQIIFSEPPPKDSRGISLTLSSFFNFQLACVENVDQIRHFSHRHPLVFMIFRMEYIHQHEHLNVKMDCEFCNDTLLTDAPTYGCHECEFYLHQPCAKYPLTVRNTMHPAHMLKLQKGTYCYKTPNSALLKQNCELCESGFSRQSSYCYNCTDCGVYFHCECALTHDFEDHKVQEHTFCFIKASLFTCDACGIKENKKCVSWVCTNCPLQVHKRCSYSFPRTVKQNRHHHELNLTYSFEVDFDYAKVTCKICFNQMNTVYCMYQCSDCNYIAHVTCATKDIVEDESVANELQEFVTTEDAEGNQVEHFSHAHPLIFTKEMPTKIDAYCDAEDLIFTDEEPTKFEAFCDACVSPISAPFYACATDDDCNFYLHKQCLELPLEIQHPLHEHRLTLTLISEKELFRCYGCGYLCNGFKYSCDDCQFNIDVRCSLLSDTLKHDGHDCTLTLIDYDYVWHDEDTIAVSKPKCSVCDGSSVSSCKFSCRLCNFHLDLGCALLPKSVTHECPKHGWNAHPLQLTYGGIEDASGIYFCDTCEESRDISHWFYDCDDCVWSNHPKCVLGRFQFKYGKTYDSEGRHDHELKLVKKALSRYNVISCGRCKDLLKDDSPLFCGECNLYFHPRCMLYCT